MNTLRAIWNGCLIGLIPLGVLAMFGWPWHVWTALGAFVTAAVGYAVVSVVWQILRDRRARRQRV
jgi:heme exporter protein D